MAHTLKAQLEKLRADFADERLQLEGVGTELESSQAAVQSQLEALKVVLQSLTDAIAENREKLHEQQSLRYRRECALAIESLAQDVEGILAAETYWLQLSQLHEKRQRLLDAEPELEENVRDFRSFDGVPDSFLHTLPVFHRQMLIEAQERLRAQVAPYLEVQHQLQSLRHDAPIRLQLLVVRDAQQSQISWILPRPVVLPSDHSCVFLDRLATAVEDAVLSVGTIDQFTLDDVETIEWGGFTGLATTGQFLGEELPEAEIAALVANHLTAALGIASDLLDIQIAEMDLAAWAAGTQTIQTVAEEAAPEPPRPDETVSAMADLSQGWYRREDIIAWQRPVKVAADSLWSEQARRLRTMLMRMLAKGAVGTAGASGDLLWKHAPEPHRRHLSDGISRLVETGVLVETVNNGRDERSLAVNPAMMVEVQNLINRDVTAFWAGIVGPQEGRDVPQ